MDRDEVRTQLIRLGVAILIMLAFALLVHCSGADAQSPADHWRYVCVAPSCWYVDVWGRWNRVGTGITLFDFQVLRLGPGWEWIVPVGVG